ncbi:putative prophage protein [Escherichia coli]|nr:putative prophage protein [Escherichia coli]SQZ33595.1 putative prophage protein [Escherichia coli]SQZ36760.1 putative prophage protein [Escherichia coli]SQZ38997.1 putative prophage protein [Escherichia coli]SQZ44471.1 putative prophage protein [Escherichia coli]
MCNALTVTKRESAPLPERLCERIAYCAILLTVYEADYSVVVAQSEGADHRYYSTPEMQNILLQNVVGHTVRKAKNFAGGATDAILSGRQVLINLMSDFVLDKTKATAEGRQWESYILERIANNARFAAGGQCVSFAPMTLCLTEGHYGEYAGLLVGYSCSLTLRRWSSSRATVTSCPISSAALTPIFSTCASASSEETKGFSPLPSAWRRAISPRTAVITKAAIVSPSVFEFSISSITSWGKRIFFICDLLLMFPVAIRMSGYFEVCTHYTKRCVDKTLDTVAHLNLICIYTNDCGVYTATPRSGGTHAGRLTKPLNEVTIMAGTQHTQTHPKFIYTFLAVHRDCMADGKNTVHVAADTLVDACEMLNDMGYISATWKGREENTLFIQKCENNFIWRFIALSTAQPRVIHIEATSEQEARQQSPAGCVMVFAARIRQEVHHA